MSFFRRSRPKRTLLFYVLPKRTEGETATLEVTKGETGMSEDIKIVRELLANLPDRTNMSIEEQRRGMDQLLGAMPAPEEFTSTAGMVDGVRSQWITFPEAETDRVVYYLHGGGYVMGSPVSHRRMVALIARAAGVPVLFPDYRLAPEHAFPAAVEDAVTGYRWLLAQGFKPGKIAIAGDSAGGGLALATLVNLRDSGDPLPARGICISPWVDLTCSSETYATKAESDPLITGDDIRAMADRYLNGRDPKTPLASPLFADLNGLPPLLVQVGSEEVLLEDSLALDRQAKACGVDCTLEVWPEMIHVWHFFAAMLREGRDAIDRVGEFCRQETACLNSGRK